MASTLAQQLGALAKQQKKPSAGGKPIRGKVSLLFDFQAAADIDVVTIHKIGCEGLEELCRKDPRFAQFHATLFSPATTSFYRESQTADVLAALDETIELFLCKLSSHFLAPAAFKALEYLLRRYKVNEYNIEPLLLCALPYHGTNEFVRLVQTLSLGNSQKGGWTWLTPMQSSGAALPRDVLVKRCINDAVILHFVCDGAKRLGQKKTFSRTYLSFYAVTLCEVVASAKVSESLLEKLLPFIVEGLASTASTDYRAATLMVLAELASRAPLGRKFMAAVTVSMLQGMEPTSEHVRTVLLVLAHLASTQSDYTELPSAALQALLAAPSLVPELESLAGSGSRMHALLKLLADSLAKQLLAGNLSASQPLQDLAHAGLLHQHAQAVASLLLAGCCAQGAGAAEAQPADKAGKKGKKKGAAAAAVVGGAAAGVREAAKQLLCTLERRHPQAVDAAINAALGTSSAAGPAPAADSDDEGEAAAKAPVDAAKRAVYDFVNEAFAGTAHALCGDTGYTLAAALSAPQAGMRSAALQQADELLALHTLSDESKAELQSSCLSGLADEDWEVVRSALCMHNLASLPEAALLPALEGLLQRLATVFLQPSRVADLPSAATASAKQALSLVVQLASTAGPAFLDAALLALMDFVMAPHHAQAVARAAVKAAQALGEAKGVPKAAAALAAALGSYQAPAEAAEPATGAGEDKKKKKKERKLAQAKALQASCMAALTGALVGQTQAVLPELQRLARAAAAQQLQGGGEGHLHARHVMLLALHGALVQLQAQPAGGRGGKASAPGASVAAVATAVQQLCLVELPVLGRATPADVLQGWQEASAELVGADGAPADQHAARACANLLHVHTQLLAAALHAALRASAEAPGAAAAVTQEQLRASFCELAALQPASAFRPHLSLLLAASLPQPQQRAAFLQQLYAAPAGSVAWEAQAAALAQHAELGLVAAPATAPPATPSKQGKGASAAAAAAQADSQTGWLPYVLAAAANPRAEVRSAAVGCLQALGSAMAAAAGAAAAVKTLALGLGSNTSLLVTDAEAATRLVARWLAPSADAAPAGPDASATPAKKRKASKAAAATTAEDTTAEEGPGAAAAAALAAMDAQARSTLAAAVASTLSQLLGCSAADLSAAAATLDSLALSAGALTPAGRGALLAQPSLALLKALTAAAPSALDSTAVSVLPSLATPLVSILACPAMLASAPQAHDAAHALASLLPSGQAASTPAALLPLRRAALAALAAQPALLPAVYAAAPDVQLSVFKALVASAAGDACADCKRAARQALEAADVAGEELVPLLEAGVSALSTTAAAEAPATEVKAKRARGQQGQAQKGAAPAAAAGDAAGEEDERLGMAVMALELLQWKVVQRSPEKAAHASQELLQALMPHIGSIVVSHGPEAGADEADEEGRQGQRQGQSSLAGYAAQLVLSGSETLLKQERAAGGAAGAGEKPQRGSGRGKAASKAGAASAGPVAASLRLELAVTVAQQAPDSAVRNAALSLVSTAASFMPEAVLGHVLQVMSVIHRAAAVQDDQHSQQVCTSAMTSLVPAWLGAGHEASALWQQVVDALPDVLPHRRLPLLSALMQAMPQGDGLPVALLLLLQKAVVTRSEVTPASGPKPSGAASLDEWLPRLASQLAAQVDLVLRLDALTVLLGQAMDSAGGRAQAPLPRMAVAFATAELKVRVDSKTHGAHVTPGASELEAASEKLLRAALTQLSALTVPLAQLQQQEEEAPGGNAKGVKRAAKASLEGLYSLLQALQALMSSEAYLKILAAAASQPSDKLKRRALRLFGDKVRTLRQELEGTKGLTAVELQKREQVLAEAALLPCAMLAALPAPEQGGAQEAQEGKAARRGKDKKQQRQQLEREQEQGGLSPLALQALLGAVAAGVAAFGRTLPDQVMSAMSATMALLSSPLPAVRGSSLVLLAVSVKAVGARLLPLLPTGVAAVLKSGRDSAAVLAGAAAPAAPSAGGEGEAAFDEDEERTPTEAAAVEASAALAALSAMVDTLGAFLSPYLGDVLGLLLSPGLVSDKGGPEGPAGGLHAAAMAAAAGVRASLPSVVPARLLLEPLFSQLSRVLGHGVASTKALLLMVTAATEAMDTRTAAAYHEQVFLFLLRLLDVRSLAPPALAGHVHEAEAATTRAVVALVMKLTESRFKPLYLRMVEWAAAAAAFDDGAAGAGAGASAAGVGRQIVLFGVSTALAERLRSVFVPYYRYLMDKAVKHLEGGAGAGAQPKKKAKRAAAAAAGADPAQEEAAWLLRLRVVRALHRGFLHDSVRFFDSEKMEKLLHPLVAQLEAQPPAPVTATLAQQGSDAELDSYVAGAVGAKEGGRHAAYDTYGVAAVACLVQMGVTANSDVFWKPLNHAVLMVTRSTSVRSRLLAVEVVAQLVARLREEFLVLLPETIPFLAELLEDTDPAVEARTQQLVALLEEISGEKLDQYMT